MVRCISKRKEQASVIIMNFEHTGMSWFSIDCVQFVPPKRKKEREKISIESSKRQYKVSGFNLVIFLT